MGGPDAVVCFPQSLQTYFVRRTTSAKYLAGTTRARSETSSLIAVREPLQQGQEACPAGRP